MRSKRRFPNAAQAPQGGFTAEAERLHKSIQLNDRGCFVSRTVFCWFQFGGRLVGIMDGAWMLTASCGCRGGMGPDSRPRTPCGPRSGIPEAYGESGAWDGWIVEVHSNAG